MKLGGVVMLIQFSVANFMSFKEETVLDMTAISAYKEHEYNLVPQFFSN